MACLINEYVNVGQERTRRVKEGTTHTQRNTHVCCCNLHFHSLHPPLRKGIIKLTHTPHNQPHDRQNHPLFRFVPTQSNMSKSGKYIHFSPPHIHTHAHRHQQEDIHYKLFFNQTSPKPHTHTHNLIQPGKESLTSLASKVDLKGQRVFVRVDFNGMCVCVCVQ